MAIERAIDYNKILNYLPNFAIKGDIVNITLDSNIDLKNINYEINNINTIKQNIYTGLVEKTNRINLNEVIGNKLDITLKSDFMYIHDQIRLEDNQLVFNYVVKDQHFINSRVNFIFNKSDYFEFKLISDKYNIEYTLNSEEIDNYILYGTYRLKMLPNNNSYYFKKDKYVNIFKEIENIKLPVIND